MKEPLGGDQVALGLHEPALGGLDDAAAWRRRPRRPSCDCCGSLRSALSPSRHALEQPSKRPRSTSTSASVALAIACAVGRRSASGCASARCAAAEAARGRRRIEGVCQPCQGGDEHVVCFPFGDLDRAAAILDARLDAFVEGERPNHLDPGVDIRREPCPALLSPALGELEEATPFDRSRSGEADGSRRRHCQLGMLHQLFVRQHLDPADERMGAAASDRREMVVGDDRGEQLVVMCGGSMLDGLGYEPLVEKPQGGPSMDLQRGAGVA